MSYTLGGITLKNPKRFKRTFVVLSSENTTINNILKRGIQARKEVFTLVYQDLTPAEANSILSEFELEEVRSFQVDEDNLSIGPTDVVIDVSSKRYPKTGRGYRQNFNLILTEII